MYAKRIIGYDLIISFFTHPCNKLRYGWTGTQYLRSARN